MGLLSEGKKRVSTSMGLLSAALNRPDELLPLLRLYRQMGVTLKNVRKEPHWAFCYAILGTVSHSFPAALHQLGSSKLRDAICVLYLVTRSLDTIEDDTSIPDVVKIPILESYYQHIYEHNWCFKCGTGHYKVLMENVHHVRSALLELDESYQRAITDTTREMGAGFAKYITKEVLTIDDYNEYCYYAAVVVGLSGLHECFTAAGIKGLPPKSLGKSTCLFFQKANIIRDYWDDINELPKPRMFWPREIWSKYAERLEDFKKEEYSTKAVQCLNELITDALYHVKDILQCLQNLQDPLIFRACAIPMIMSFGTLTLCYNNRQVFKGTVKIRRGLLAKMFYETQTLSDAYTAFFEFSTMLKSKVDKNDPYAASTLKLVNEIIKTCQDSGLINERKFYISQSKPFYRSLLIILAFLVLAFILRQSIFAAMAGFHT